MAQDRHRYTAEVHDKFEEKVNAALRDFQMTVRESMAATCTLICGAVDGTENEMNYLGAALAITVADGDADGDAFAECKKDKI